MMNKTKICSICGKEFSNWGNNPRPFQRGLCCDNCNKEIILPLRDFEKDKINKALLIKPNDKPNTISYVEVKEFKDIQRFVGGYVTIFPNPIFYDLTFFCDEDGELKRLKDNKLAFELYGIKVVGNLLIVPSNLRKVYE